jgi:Flp pilus assembly protein TadB
VTAALLAGTGFALGLLAIAAGLAPRRTSLADALDFLTRPRPAPVITLDAGGWAARLGRPAAALLAGLGLPGKALRADLAILGRPPERLLAEQATAAVAGLLLVPAMTALLALGGVSAGWQLPAGGAVLLAVAGFAAPALGVRQEAAARRAATRHALAAFLDLVVIATAGGAGTEAALTYAAATGQGPAFTQIRQALETARLTRQPPWATLGQLGTELGVTELTELAASITLAGTEGAKVRASLAAKSAAMRARQLAEAEAGAQAATERMSLPLVVLFAGFLALIGYPAIVHVINGI